MAEQGWASTADHIAADKGSAAPDPNSATTISDSAPAGNGQWATTADHSDQGRFHPLDSLLNGVQNFWDKVNPVMMAQGMAAAAQDPLTAIKGAGAQTADIYNKMKSAWNSGNHVEAARHLVNYALSGIPGLGAQIENAQDQQAAGNYSGAVGSSMGIGASLALPEHVPAAMRLAGRGLKATAVPVAESAMNLPWMSRAYSKTPGAAALEETTGIRPATVAESAQNKSLALTADLERKAADATRAGTTGSLAPARQVIDQRLQTATGGGSTKAPPELKSMRRALTRAKPGFAGNTLYAPGQNTPISFTPQQSLVKGQVPSPLLIDASQSPSQILQMKREFAKDFATYNPLFPEGEMPTARTATHKLDSELDRTVPGAAQLNQRISSLIPVAQREAIENLKAGVVQRSIQRFAPHTGALVGGIEGYRLAGIPGAIGGIVAPELLSSSAGKMAAARGLHGAGEALARTPRIPLGRTAGVAALLQNPYRDASENQLQPAEEFFPGGVIP